MNRKSSLVSTVLNDVSGVELFIQDIERQSIKPNEIVITDAGSVDGSFERLLEWKKGTEISINVLHLAGCNVAKGRNYSITNAKHEIIISTDFGCRFHPAWLESLLLPFNNKDVYVVGGAFTVDYSNLTSMAAKANYLLTNGYQLVLDDHFIPSSRSIAYKREVWENVGHYDEWLTLAADDLIFGLKVKAAGYAIHLVEEPYVFWGRYEKAGAYGREAYRYGLGDGEARVNIKNTISTFIETIARYFIFFGLGFWVVLSSFMTLPLWIILLLAPGLVGFRSYWNALRRWIKHRSKEIHIGVYFYSLLLVELTRYQYLKGFFNGYFLSSKQTKAKARELRRILR